MVDINEVAENIYMIDEQLYSIPKSGSVYFLVEEHRVQPIYDGDTIQSLVEETGK